MAGESAGSGGTSGTAPNVNDAAVEQLRQQIIAASTPIDDGQGGTYYDPALPGLVAAYNALKGSSDKYAPINAGNGQIGVFDPKTGSITWTKEPTSGPATVSPGQGVLQPDGTYKVPVPSNQSPTVVHPGEAVLPPAGTEGPASFPAGPPPPAKTQAEIDAESQANVNQSNAASDVARTNADTARINANSNTPASQIQIINAKAQADADAALKLAQDKIDAGIALSDKDKLELQNKLEQIAADAKAQRDQAQTQFEHDLNQPNVQSQLDTARETADTGKANAATAAATAENNRVYQQQQAAATERQRQTGVLTDQAKGATDFVNQGIKLGVAPTMGLIRGMLDPLQIALHLSSQAVQSGQVPANAMPTPVAPAPAGPQPAPAPAPPAATAAPAPAPTAPTPTAPTPAFGETRNY